MANQSFPEDLKGYQTNLEEIICSLCDNADGDRHKMLKSTLEGLYHTIGLSLKILDENYDIRSDDFVVQEKGPFFMNDNSLLQTAIEAPTSLSEDDGCTIIEGVFDGRHMMGSNGNQYVVPENYASKSKLVEGDILKLKINQNGTFTFKQINPTLRRRMRGCLVYDQEINQYFALFKGARWCVLNASVQYYKGEQNDEITFVIPKDGRSKWAAIENIIKNDGNIDFVKIHSKSESSI